MELSEIVDNSEYNNVFYDSDESNNRLNKEIELSSSNHKSKDTKKTISECCICFYPLITEVSVLECNHVFHFSCLSKWQNHRKTQNIICPICQQNTIISNIYNNRRYSTFEDITHILDKNDETDKSDKNDKTDKTIRDKEEKHLVSNNRDFSNVNENISFICCNIL